MACGYARRYSKQFVGFDGRRRGASRAAAPELALQLHEFRLKNLLTWSRDRDVDLAVTVLEVSGSEFQTEALWE